MPSIDEEGKIFELVASDVQQGLGEVFPGGRGYERAEFSEDGGIAGERVEAVIWTWNGIDSEGFQGLVPTDAEVTVSGVTLVEKVGEDEFTFRRYIDWLTVASQIGLSFDGRPTVTREPSQP